MLGQRQSKLCRHSQGPGLRLDQGTSLPIQLLGFTNPPLPSQLRQPPVQRQMANYTPTRFLGLMKMTRSSVSASSMIFRIAKRATWNNSTNCAKFTSFQCLNLFRWAPEDNTSSKFPRTSEGQCSATSGKSSTTILWTSTRQSL